MEGETLGPTAVSWEQLEAVAALGRPEEPNAPPEPPKPPPYGGDSGPGNRFDIRGILRERGISFVEKPKPYGAVLALDRCLTSTEHESGACIIELASGALAYKCQHASCSGKGWPDARAALGLGDSANSGRSANVGAEPWEPPSPLDASPRPPFPPDVLPTWLRNYVEALATATQTPPDLGGMLALAAVATACGGKAVVQVRPGWREPLNLFVVVALPPGERKSAVFSAVTAPVEAYEREERRRVQAEIAAATSRRKILERTLTQKQAEAAKAADQAERDKLTAEAEELAVDVALIDVPAPPRLVVDDCSPEKLASLLAEHGGRMAVLSAEGGIFDLLAGRYTAGGAPNLEAFLKGHAGDALRVDRVGRPSEFVAFPALTVGLAVQPAVVHGLADRPGFRGRGLLARFLYALPESQVGRRVVAPPPVSEDVLLAYHLGLGALLRLRASVDADGDPSPHALHLDPAAAAAFARFETDLEPRLGETADLGHVRDWAGKLAGTVARLAGLIHLAEHHGRSEPWAIPIGAEAVEAAVRLARDYLVLHAVAAFGHMGADPAIADAQQLLRHVEAKAWASFTKRDLFEAAKGRFKTVEALSPALDLLRAHGYVRQRPAGPRSGPGRKPSPTYDVNPLWAPRYSRDSQNAGRSTEEPDAAAGTDGGPTATETEEPTSAQDSANSAHSAGAKGEPGRHGDTAEPDTSGRGPETAPTSSGGARPDESDLEDQSTAAANATVNGAAKADPTSGAAEADGAAPILVTPGGPDSGSLDCEPPQPRGVFPRRSTQRARPSQAWTPEPEDHAGRPHRTGSPDRAGQDDDVARALLEVLAAASGEPQHVALLAAQVGQSTGTVRPVLEAIARSGRILGDGTFYCLPRKAVVG